LNLLTVYHDLLKDRMKILKRKLNNCVFCWFCSLTHLYR